MTRPYQVEDAVLDVAAYAERLCSALKGEMLGDFRFQAGRFIFALTPYGPLNSNALHIQPSPADGDLDAPSIPGLLIRRGRPLESVIHELRDLLRPPGVLAALVGKMEPRESVPPEVTALFEAGQALARASHAPNFDPIVEAFQTYREAV